MTYKTIFSGRLEFGSSRSYEKVWKMYQHRVENYYKKDILLNGEEFFCEEDSSLNVPRLITQANDKSWKNTMNLLKFIAQYAIAGGMSAWMTDNGKVLKHCMIEPESDKVAVQAFIKGRELIQEQGRESEAKEALSKAIEKFERHALAYERRGFVNYQLRNFKDAEYDYSKSIDINPSNPEPYFGRAYVNLAQEDFASAILDLDKAIKRSIPLQAIYWNARRLKADCHLKLEEFDKAVFELKLFTKRRFAKEDPNVKWRKNAFFNYGLALLKLERFKEAVEAFDASIEIDHGKEVPSNADQLLYRGIALQKAGDEAFVKDLEAAANQGSERAAQLLAEV